MKVVAPPIEGELFFSIGIFFINYDVINRKTIRKQPRRKYSTIQKGDDKIWKWYLETTETSTYTKIVLSWSASPLPQHLLKLKKIDEVADFLPRAFFGPSYPPSPASGSSFLMWGTAFLDEWLSPSRCFHVGQSEQSVADV